MSHLHICKKKYHCALSSNLLISSVMEEYLTQEFPTVEKHNNDLNADSIEPEQEGVDQITVPFDPNLIRIRRDPFTLGELIDKIEYEEVRFDTSFQRKSDLWDPTKQSRLIESVLLRLPLPAFYFDEIVENENSITEMRTIWQVIDGLQRCSVFRNFIVRQSLRLQNLEFLTQFNGHTYSELPRELQRRIKQTPITTYVLEKGTPEEVKFNIFKRINTGGLVLTPQEIRHAMNQGVASDFVTELAELPQFSQATRYIIKKERMEDQDFITRFVAFFLLGYQNYEPDLDSFMTHGMRAIRSLTDLERMTLKENFTQAMELAMQIFRDDAFRKRTDPHSRRRPLNKALFEVESVVFAKMTQSQRAILIEHRDFFKGLFIQLNRNEQFRYAISSGTGQKDSVTRRYAEFIHIVEQTINDHIEI